MRYVNWWGPHVFKFLFQFEETILYFFLNIVRQLLLSAYELWVFRVPTSFHNTTSLALERLLKLVYASVGHRHLLVFLYLLSGLGRDAVYCWASRVHDFLIVGQWWRLTPLLWTILRSVPQLLQLLVHSHLLLILIDIMGRVWLFGTNFRLCTAHLSSTVTNLRYLMHLWHLQWLFHSVRLLLVSVCEGSWVYIHLLSSWTLTWVKSLYLWWSLVKSYDIGSINWKSSMRFGHFSGELTTCSMLYGSRLTIVTTRPFEDGFIFFIQPLRLHRAELTIICLITSVWVLTLIYNLWRLARARLLDLHRLVIRSTFYSWATLLSIRTLVMLRVVLMLLSGPVLLSIEWIELSISMVLTVCTFNNCGQITWILILNRVLSRVAILLTARSSKIRELKRRLKSIFDTSVLFTSRRQTHCLTYSRCLRSFSSLLETFYRWICLASIRLVDTLTCVLCMKMAHTVLVEIFFLNQRQICIPFHVSHGLVWQSARLEFKRLSNHLLLIHNSDTLVELARWHATHLLLVHLAHVLAPSTSLGIVLLLLLLLLLDALKLAKCIPICLHVAIVWQIGIIRSTLVLKRLYGCCKVYFALEKFLTGYLV